jgi:hypothetical protein
MDRAISLEPGRHWWYTPWPTRKPVSDEEPVDAFDAPMVPTRVSRVSP